ncbi:hypothetical protein OAG96_00835 [Akkermansiaceae bacterium]|nr:hypothetical protein [Akkermansiaceae bacterium]
MTLFAKHFCLIALFLSASVGLCSGKDEKAKLPEANKITLELKSVHPKNGQLAKAVQAGEEVAPAGWKLYQLPIIDDETRKKIGEEPILLARRNIVTADQVQRAIAVPPRYGTTQVRLTDKGGDRLFNATKKMRSGVDRLAVVLSGKVIIAPTVNGSLSQSFIIEGLDGSKEVDEVVAVLSPPLSE